MLLRKLCGAYAEKEGLFMGGGGGCGICVNSKVTFMEIVMDFLPVYFMVLPVLETRAKFGLGTPLDSGNRKIPTIRDAELFRILKF